MEVDQSGNQYMVGQMDARGFGIAGGSCGHWQCGKDAIPRDDYGVRFECHGCRFDRDYPARLNDGR